MPAVNKTSQDRVHSILLLTGFLTLCGILLLALLHWQWLSWQILQWQGQLHRQIAALLRAALAPSLETKLLLLGLCFLYGVFHAAGPGHGKAVLSTYLATHNSQLKRAMWLSLGAALMQAVVAILLTTLVVALLGWTQLRAQQFGQQLDKFSFWLVSLLGIFLTLRALYRLWLLKTASKPDSASPLNIRRLQPVSHKQAIGARATQYNSSRQDTDCHCGHAHTPDLQQLTQAQDWKSQFAIMLTMGIRPCTGALLTLVLAKSLGLFYLGMAAVLLMALGTAGTVCLLAWFSHSMRHLALRLLSHRSSGPWFWYGLEIVSLLGGVLLILLGYSMAQAFSVQVSPFFRPN